MQPTPSSRALATVAVLIALFGPASRVNAQDTPPAAEPAAAPAIPVRPPQLPWELRPYEVAVELTVSPSPALSTSASHELQTALTQRLEDDLGAMCQLTLSPAPAASNMPAARLAALSVESARELWMEHPAEKVIAISVLNERGRWSFAAREWDRASETLGPVSQGSAVDDRLAVASAARVVKEAFRTLAQVDAANGKNITLRIRGGELIPPDPTAAPLTTGLFLKPFVRAMNRKGELQKVQMIPWTLLRVDSVDRATAEVLAYSVFPAPVGATKKRLESLAIEVRPTYPETTLQVVPRTNPGNPVAAAKVEVVDRLAAPTDPDVDRQSYRTDRDGRFTVPATDPPQVRYAIVASGTATLARVPFLPGLEKEVTVEVADDMPRLTAEGEVSLLEADLIELVARRKVLQLRADTAAKAGKVAEVKSLIAELKSLPTQPQYQQRIDLSRTTAVELARSRKDLVAEARIRKMYAALAEASKTHLDDEKFQQQLKDLQDIADLRAPGDSAPGRKK